MWVVPLCAVLLAACGGDGSHSSPTSPPATLSYPGPQTFIIHSAITPVAPTSTGGLTSFSINPALPTGLSLRPDTGTLSGTPIALAGTTNYTVSATAPSGATASATISITVNDVAPSQVTYGSSAFTFTSTLPPLTLTPTAAGGTVVSWSIDPALPAGLNFSSTDGSISGTPTAAAAAANYVVTARNSGGQGSVILKIEVDAGPLVDLGHQKPVWKVRATATNVLSVDTAGYWILWDYARASIVAKGRLNCGIAVCEGMPVDMAGSTVMLSTSTGFEVRSTSDGHTLADISTSSPAWLRLATDGSYVVAGSHTALSAWSSSGQLLFSRPGDYFGAAVFAGPGQIRIALGPAGANVIETLGVPDGTATTGPSFLGTFNSWFADGGRFTTTVFTTLLVYDADTVQRGSFTSLWGNGLIIGQGHWISSYGANGLRVYPADATDPAPVATFTFDPYPAQPSISGSTLAFLANGSSKVSLVDLSGATPTRTDFTAPVRLTVYAAAEQPYAFVSDSEWLIGTSDGVLLDGPSFAGTPRRFGLGEAVSIAGGTGHFAIATAAGIILYYNSRTLEQEGQIAFAASKLLMSQDGSLLVAQGGSDASHTGQVYTLPGGGSLYSWPLAGELQALSADGSLLAWASPSSNGPHLVTAGPPTGGSPVFSQNVPGGDVTPSTTVLSPDGTAIAVSAGRTGGTLLWQNKLVATLPAVAVVWLDNSHLVVNNYQPGPGMFLIYSGCSVVDSTGKLTGTACESPEELGPVQLISSDAIYGLQGNWIRSISSGSTIWRSGDQDFSTAYGAVAGGHVIFVFGTGVLAQPY